MRLNEFRDVPTTFMEKNRVEESTIAPIFP